MKNPFNPFFLVAALLLPWVLPGQVITVQGAIDSRDMGLTLIHEHILVDWIGADSTGYHRWDRKEVVARALPYLQELRQYGVGTFLDCTPAYLGRDPRVLKELSEATGIHILTNTGFYGAGTNKFVPGFALDSSPGELAAIWIDEFRQGIDNTGIRPGFIKISVENRDTLPPMHEKLVRAAALTHLETGLAIVSHTGGDAPALAQLKILQEMGVSPDAFVWTHAQNGTFEGYLQAARQGAWISLDHIQAGQPGPADGTGNIPWYVQTLSRFKSQGILDHVLISHDAGWYDVGEPNGGGYRGYTDLFTHLIPRLRENGFRQDDLDLVLKENPGKAYALRIRKN
ncbi:phosphotriesterase [Robiginitalea sp. SC105]|uniref:phosphotriesterase family protein n=1 Tax=Robiginitalea sp. SC105 TaxID=2762332 RepID=UPI00163AD4A3|nr:phosphotriesterase [Robiginitalea sp. SC105]MBC2840070.1 phosphotriesterase [Robiginitalea sp. SC105]